MNNEVLIYGDAFARSPAEFVTFGCWINASSFTTRGKTEEPSRIIGAFVTPERGFRVEVVQLPAFRSVGVPAGLPHENPSGSHQKSF